MRRIALALAFLLVASAGLAQNIGGGYRYGPSSGFVNVPVGIPGSAYIPPPPPPATYPTGAWAIYVAGNASPSGIAGVKTWYDSSGNSRDAGAFTGSMDASGAYLFNGLGGGSGCSYAIYDGPDVASVSAFTIVVVGRPRYPTSYEEGPKVFWDTANGAGTTEQFVVFPDTQAAEANRLYSSSWTSFTGRSFNDPNLVTTAFRCDGATMTVFVDGVKTDEVAQPADVMFDPSYVCIGAKVSYGTPGTGTTGQIKVVAIYLSALSDAEITGTSW